MKMMRAIWIICVGFFLGLSSAVKAAEDAPFGLHWGATLDFLMDRSMLGELDKDNGQTRIYQVKKLSGAPPQTDVVRIVIHRQLGVQRIIWTSKDIEDDASGSKALEAYQAMKRKLTDNFGRPRSSAEETGAALYTGADQFYQCLAYDGCSSFASRWRTDDGDVVLRLIPSPSGQRGRIETTYDGPEWEKASGAKPREKGRGEY